MVQLFSVSTIVFCLLGGFLQDYGFFLFQTTAAPANKTSSENLEVEEDNEKDVLAASQNFYPSFALFNQPPLGHSRPFLYQEGAFSQVPATAYRQNLGYNNVKYNNPFRRENYQISENKQSLLGSGNFGVIRGGTFYSENENENENGNAEYGRYNNYNPFSHNNGHGRPSYFFGNSRPQQEEQFANFRDFADINTPNTAYSQFVVVYSNKNEHRQEPKSVKPKNIIERLAMLDLEKKTVNEEVTKLSPTKKKLALLPIEKKVKKKTASTPPPSDLNEPLLALS